MKKILASCLLMILVLIYFVPFSYGELGKNRIFSTDKETLEGFLYSNYDHIYINSSSDDFYINNGSEDPDPVKVIGSKSIRNSWAYAVYNLCFCINESDSYKEVINDISDGSSSKDIDNTLVTMNALKEAIALLKDENYLTGAAINKITNGRFSTRLDFAKYISMVSQKLNAAYTNETGNSVPGTIQNISVNDTYEKKFKYNTNQIKEYLQTYNTINLDDKNGLIKKLWELKLNIENDKNGLLQNINNDSNLFIDEKDNFQTLLAYNQNQILLYKSLFGTGFTNSSIKNNPEQIEVVKKEWDYMMANNKHSSAYNAYLYSGNLSGYSNISNSTTALDSIPETSNKIKLEEFTESDVLRSIKSTLTDLDTKDNEDGVSGTKKNFEIYNIPERTGASNKDKDPTDVDTIVDSANSFINNGTEEKIAEQDIKNLSDSIYNILLIVGIVIAVIVGAIIGIRFMVGSIEEKAEIKQVLIPYIVGCVVVFGAFGIWKIIVIILSRI